MHEYLEEELAKDSVGSHGGGDWPSLQIADCTTADVSSSLNTPQLRK